MHGPWFLWLFCCFKETFCTRTQILNWNYSCMYYILKCTKSKALVFYLVLYYANCFWGKPPLCSCDRCMQISNFLLHLSYYRTRGFVVVVVLGCCIKCIVIYLNVTRQVTKVDKQMLFQRTAVLWLESILNIQCIKWYSFK